MPELSVIVTSYNHGKYLRESIESILSEKIPNMELIVIDDFSTDNSFKTISDLPVKIIRNEKNKGIAYCRNKGLKLSSAKFITFFDGDNILLSGGIKKRLTFLKNNPRYNAVGGISGGVIDSNGKRMNFLENTPPLELSYEFLKEGGKYCCALWLYLFRKKIIEDMIFDETLKFCDDSDFLLKFLKKEKIPIIKVPVLLFRIHDKNTSFIYDGNSVTFSKKVISESLLVNMSHGIIPNSLKN